MTTSWMLTRRGIMSGALALGGAAVLGPRFSFAQENATPAAGELDPVTEVAWVKFNLNAASDDQFRTIPGVGDQMLHEFNEYKPYTSIEQFRREIGKYVSEEEVATYERYLFVPVDPTSTDEATLQQLPGVSADIAAELIKNAPFADATALQTSLAQFVSAEQVSWAAPFLAPSATDRASWVKFNLNTATDAQFLTVPGVGDQMLHEFNEYKPYVSIAQFREEIGKYVSEEDVATYERYLFVPVDPAQADEATLQQLPGVDADKAATLAQSMPYADANALISALSGVVSAEQAAAAPAFLTAA
jgi:DNA uptake protein ComE-like DNA-binding protein